MAAYLDNRLNTYETYTYNLQLYMVDPNNMSRLDGAINDGTAILLADNATQATYNISSIEQIYSIGHNIVREAVGNKFTMVIQEPNGATLLSQISSLASQLGVQNHIHAGYILSIGFRGRRRDGQAHKFDQTFYYPLIIRSVDIKVTEGGATYNIDLVENSSTGYQYLNNGIREQITIVAQTVGEFISLFQDRYNESIVNAWAANPAAGRRPDVYRFEFDDTTASWARWRFQALDEPFESSGANFEGLPGENPSLQVIINNGSNITTIFGQVLQLTSEYKRIITSQNKFSRDKPSGEITTKLDSFPTFFKVITNVEYGKYDEFSGQYSKTIIYKIKAYTVTDEILDGISYQQSIGDIGVQSRRVENLMANNFLRKKYEYYYTGANTEVLEFDMQFNMAYYYMLAYGDGYYGDPNVQSPQAAKDRNEVIARLREVTAARKQLAASQQSLNRVKASTTEMDVGIVRTLERSVQRAFGNFNSVFDENIQFLKTEFGLSPTDINYQLRFIQDVVDDSDVLTSDNDTRSGALKYGAIKSNLENPSDLLNIELGIRGDPYWLGIPNSLYNQQRNVDELADFEAGAPSFFLKVNLPDAAEDISGRRKPIPDHQISGVYTVRSVINRYQGGQFTQYLGAVRDLATNVSTVWDILEGDQSVIQGIERARIQSERRNKAQEQEDNFRRVTGRSSGTGNIR